MPFPKLATPPRRLAPTLVAILAFDLAAAAGAADDTTARTHRLDPVAVTATRNAQPIAELLADLTVIDADEIARAGAGSLSELLQRQAGIEVVRNGGPASVSGVSIRGANRGQTLVLVDGLRVGSASTGATTLEAIPLDAIERIEILRGPASSLYGADAIGGVIQVFTRGATDAPRASASAGYGSHATRAINGAGSGRAGPLRFAVQAGARDADGFNAVSNPNAFVYDPDRDGYSGSSASVDLRLPVADEQELFANAWRNRQNARFDGGPGRDDRTITTLEAWQVGSRNRLSAAWVSRVTAGQSRDDSVSRTGFGDFPLRTRQRQFAWQNEFVLPLGALTAGYERREERVDADPPFAVSARDTDALFAIYQWRDGAHALQANLRRDDSSQYGAKTTGALAYGYRLQPDLRVTAAYGSAYKAPSFNDLYYPGFSNPALVPEAATNVEGGIYWSPRLRAGRLEARAIAYRNRVDKLIVFQCDASFNCAPQNVDRATLSGVTLGIDLHDGERSVVAALDLVDPRDDASGKTLPRRARQHGVVTLSDAVGPVRIGVEVVASSHRYDDAANRNRLAGYALVNLSAEWALAPTVNAFLRADNVFDRDYALATDYATGGATVFGGLRWRL